MRIRLITTALFRVLVSSGLSAQSGTPQANLVGSWHGTLVIGRDSFDITFNFTRENDAYTAALISRQLGIYGMPAELVRVENNRLTVRLEMIAAEYTGRLRLDDAGSSIEFVDGEWFQEGEMVPIILRPVTQ